MKAKKRSRGYGTILLFALAATLLIFSTAGSSRAALTIYSSTYGAELSLQSIGVTLLENDKAVNNRDYAKNGEWKIDGDQKLLSDLPEELNIGEAYEERLAAQNSGTIDEYVRMTVYRYWVDGKTAGANGAEPARRTDLKPEYIQLTQPAGWDANWLWDANGSTPERQVFYYRRPLTAGADGNGEVTAPLTESLIIKGWEGVQMEVTQKQEGNVLTTTYTYDGATFVVEATVDAVQTHNAADAIKSAWGVDVTVAADGNIALNEG